MKDSSSTLLSRRLANSEMVLRQLRHLAGHIPCELCSLKGDSNIETDGGCRHRPHIDTDAFDLEVIQRIERFIKKHHTNLSACIECSAGAPSGHANDGVSCGGQRYGK